MIKITEIDGLWNIEYNGIIIDTFVSYDEAEDAVLILRYELDTAFENIGSEFDGTLMGFNTSVLSGKSR